jgi:hypothetical protein
VLRDQGIFVALIHGANTSPKQTHDSRWRALPLERIESVMGPDWPLHPVGQKAGPVESSARPVDLTSGEGALLPSISVGIHVHSQPEQFAETLRHLHDNSPSTLEVLLAVTQLANDAARGDKKSIQLTFAWLQTLEPRIEAQETKEVLIYSGVLAESDRRV